MISALPILASFIFTYASKILIDRLFSYTPSNPDSPSYSRAQSLIDLVTCIIIFIATLPLSQSLTSYLLLCSKAHPFVALVLMITITIICMFIGYTLGSAILLLFVPAFMLCLFHETYRNLFYTCLAIIGVIIMYYDVKSSHQELYSYMGKYLQKGPLLDYDNTDSPDCPDYPNHH